MGLGVQRRLAKPGASLLAAIIAAGFGLRLFRLGAESLWYDETVSVYLAGSPAAELLRHTAGDIHPPGYYLLLRGWLILAGYPTGRASPDGTGLEWLSGFFSAFFGALLIALTYVLARRLAGRAAGPWAAAIVAFSPFNVWYSQEVRMYTLGACLGAIAVYAAVRACREEAWRARWVWWTVYAAAAAGGLYALYYFVFLLVPLNAWVLIHWLRQRRGARWAAWLGANAIALLLYLPWLPFALRQALDPPVPPWRTATPPLAALGETWRALSLGQSAPGWTVVISALALAVFVLGLAKARERGALLWTTLGPPLLIVLLTALVTPLHHVRYMFTYSPPVYAALAAGMAWLWDPAAGRMWRRIAAALVCILWLAGIAATLRAFWFDPQYRADDHRGAVAALHERWRPGDALLVNAGYAYPAVVTYWPGEIAGRNRLTDPLPEPRRGDGALVMVTTGHVGGDAGLGWGDPKSDFFTMPAGATRAQIEAMFQRFDRVWHYRIYDTVSDPAGQVRALLETEGAPIEDRAFSGEANLRLQAFAPSQGATWVAGLPEAAVEGGLDVQWRPITGAFSAGDRLYGALTWRAKRSAPAIATSVRLVDEAGTIWAQPQDERPLGTLLPSERWPDGLAQHQGLALDIPAGTPPGEYTLELVIYDPATGKPYPITAAGESLTSGRITVRRPEPAPALRPALARFGPLRLIEADSPATEVTLGDAIPVSFLWQAGPAPGEPLVIVIQLLDADGGVVAGREEEPVGGRYPTQGWIAGEIVRDPHALSAPADPGDYRLVVGVYRAADRARLPLSGGAPGAGDDYVIKELRVRGGESEEPPGE